nr:DotH/IcmK family type IV secretion protein [Escherichia coli]
MLIRRHWKSYLHLFCSRSSLYPWSGAVCPQRNGRYERAAKTSPLTPIPRISSQTVSLSAGASIPQVRVFPNQATTVTFSDATGHPWVLGPLHIIRVPVHLVVNCVLAIFQDRRYFTIHRQCLCQREHHSASEGAGYASL